MGKRKARKPSNIPEGESKADRFKRVITPRVVKAIKAINVIGYCSGPAYESTDEQVEQICKVLVDAINAMDSKFKAKPKSDVAFDFLPE